MFKPRDYQLRAIRQILHALTDYDKVLFQLSTGGGKTVIFCSLIEKFPNHKFLILVNRAELVEQTARSLAKFGIVSEQITSKTKDLNHHANVYVAMERTLWNRLAKNPEYLPKIDLTIIDECHRAEFDKFLPSFKKVVGFTATPVRVERITFYRCSHCGEEAETLKTCCNSEMMEWSRPHVLADHYETIVLGPSITDLIDQTHLMPEIPYAVKIADLNRLKSRAGEYTEESIQEAYIEPDALFNVVKNYKELCLGRKTIIFNASVKQNQAVYDRFIGEGIDNIRHFDSVNNSTPRAELVQWFKTTPEAILCNVNIFTTGFDVTDVGAIIVNRPTQSLSLWLQMVGRGARPDFIAGKTDFIVVDGGANIQRLQEWSATRDWVKIFEKGLKPEKPKKEVLEDVKECKECGNLIAKTTSVCPSCGAEQPTKKKKPKSVSEIVAAPIKKPPYPIAEKIIKYTEKANETQHYAFKVLRNQIIELFRGYKVSKQTYETTLKNGILEARILKIFRPIYFAIIKSALPAGNNITLKNSFKKVLTEISKFYGIS
jgi:superfamily II DNA or RNA helicase